MVAVKVKILKIIDNSFPIFVECVLVDLNGERHYFHDKLSVFSIEDSVQYPCFGELRCQITQYKRNTVVIETLLPDDIESITGKYRFEVYRNQVFQNSKL